MLREAGIEEEFADLIGIWNPLLNAWLLIFYVGSTEYFLIIEGNYSACLI
jgi:DNA-binding transcriptional regulator YdaS (Cro superfamily)